MNTNKIRRDLMNQVSTMTTPIVRSFLLGMAFGLGMLTMGIMAVSVTGTIKTWTTGDTLTATDLNTAITGVKTVVEGIPNWTKATNGTDAVDYCIKSGFLQRITTWYKKRLSSC